jgi:hypothetical protein
MGRVRTTKTREGAGGPLAGRTWFGVVSKSNIKYI